MKKALLVLLFTFVTLSAAHGKDVHSFSCSDSDNGPLVASPAGKTKFTWTKNGQQIFDRTFTDAYSGSRNQYVAFYCEKNIIRYRLFDCSESAVRPFCSSLSTPVSNKLEIEQRRVETSQTLIDGEDYKFITHYLFKSSTDQPIKIKGLSFVTDVDQSGSISDMERQAASQYSYTLVGPSGALISDVLTEDGKLEFDLSASPISVGNTFQNFGIAAKPKLGIEAEGNSSIRWVLDTDSGSKGVVATNANVEISSGEVSVSASRATIFSRGISGLKISHFNPQNLIEEPKREAQAFYRMRVENISAENASQLRRITLEMRMIGMEKQNGAPLEATDFSIVEIGADATAVGVPTNQIFAVADNRNDSKALSIQIELADFVLPPNESRGLEIRIANLVNDSAGESDDDGAAVQLIQERFEDGSKFTLNQLESAAWVWTDFSGTGSGADRDDWRSGFNLDMNTRPIIIRE